MARAAAFSLLRWARSSDAAKQILMKSLASESISLRAEAAIFIKSWIGDLHGYDPDKQPSEQSDVLQSWSARLSSF
jgi:hypothetical protein